MSWGFVAVAGATVISGAMSADAAKDAAKAQGRAADAATAEQARQYDQTREDFAPWRSTGSQALNAINRLFGFSTEPTGGYFSAEKYLADNPDVAAGDWSSKNPQEHWERFGRFEGRPSPMIGGTPGREAGAPDMSGFFTSPDYNFRRTEGMRGIEGSFAARGGAQSGNALRALTEFNSNLASGEFGNYFNRLAGLAGVGQTATTQTAAFGQNAANNIANNHLFAGDARASGIHGQANAWGNTIENLGGLYGYYSGMGGGGGGISGPTVPGYAGGQYGFYRGGGVRLA